MADGPRVGDLRHAVPQLKEIREAYPEYAELSFSACQQTLRRLNRAFEDFYRRAKSGQNAGYPRFKPRQRYDTIFCEDLRVSNMRRSASGTLEEPGTCVAAKSGLNRSILDAGWAGLIVILEGKAESAGRQVLKINPAYTSLTCAECGHCAKENRPVIDVFQCVACSHEQDPDHNGARTYSLQAGLA